MKLSKFIILLCLNFNIINGFFPYQKPTTDQESIKNLTDSIFNKEKLKTEIDFLYFIANWEKLVKQKEIAPTGEDYKRVAIGYASLRKAKKSALYLKKYINKQHDIDILNHQAFLNVSDTEEFKNILKQYKPTINGWVLFFFSVGIVGVFLSIIISLRRKSDVCSNLLISLFVFFHSLFIIHLSLFLSRYEYETPHSLYFSALFPFLYGPLLFFYLKRILEKYILKKRDLLHLIPFIILLIYLIPIYSTSAEEKLEVLLTVGKTYPVLFQWILITQIFSLTVYAFLIFKIYKNNLQNPVNTHLPQIRRWQRNLMIFYVFYVVFFVTYAMVLMNIIAFHDLIYFKMFSISLIILYISYIAYDKPIFFDKNCLFGNIGGSKYQKSGLTKSYSIELKNQLLIMFQEHKIFKESNLSLDTLAEKMLSTRHNISQVINEHFGMSFFHFVNKYRIGEAIEILDHDVHRKLHIIDIAYDVGFNNKVTFNKAFKIITNMTPTQYIKNLRGKNNLKSNE